MKTTLARPTLPDIDDAPEVTLPKFPRLIRFDDALVSEVREIVSDVGLTDDMKTNEIMRVLHRERLKAFEEARGEW